MKFYLSSYKLGRETEQLKKMIDGRKIGFIPNAIDYLESKTQKESNARNIKDLLDIAIDIEMLDLKDYFGKKKELEKKIDTLGGIWIRGGNTFVLRQAMYLSGCDEIVKYMQRDDFLYSGYSAGICILAPTLRGLQQVDDPTMMPYKESKKVIWEGLGILDHLILPHYKSDHPESADIDKEVEFCRQNNIPFRTLSDGEVIVIE